MAFESLMMILETCREKEIPFWEAILLDDMNERNANRQESMEQMRTLWHAMQEAADRYDGAITINYQNGVFQAVVSLSFQPIKTK